MKKSIRLLVENLFNDLYDIDQESNLTIDIADKMYTYEIGDIYYQDKESYAICCGTQSEFLNNKPRFIPYKYRMKSEQWTTNRKIPKKLIRHPFDHTYTELNVLTRIDENGYENTQIIKNNYNIRNYPAFRWCKINFGENSYIPAIDELQIFMKNKATLESKNNIQLVSTRMQPNKLFDMALLSSTCCDDKCIIILNIYDNFTKYNLNYWQAFYQVKHFLVLPFIKVD